MADYGTLAGGAAVVDAPLKLSESEFAEFEN
jgi:hypothetical protein